MPYIGYGFGIGRAHKAGVAYDATAASYFAAVPNAFDAARKTIINTLIAGLRTDGNLTKLDRLWLFANTTTGNAVIDVIGNNAATLVNAPAFVADQGYTGDGATSYMNLQFTPSTQGTNFVQNSASMGFYSRTDSIQGNKVDLGSDNGTIYNKIYGRDTGGVIYSYINDTSATMPSAAAANSLGLISVRRTDATNCAVFQNGTSLLAYTGNSGIIDNVQYALASNDAGTPLRFTTRQLSCIYFGSGAIDQSALYTRIQQYMTDLGTNV